MISRTQGNSQTECRMYETNSFRRFFVVAIPSHILGVFCLNTTLLLEYRVYARIN